jgi:hypothetical protein
MKTFNQWLVNSVNEKANVYAKFKTFKKIKFNVTKKEIEQNILKTNDYLSAYIKDQNIAGKTLTVKECKLIMFVVIHKQKRYENLHAILAGLALCFNFELPCEYGILTNEYWQNT